MLVLKEHYSLFWLEWGYDPPKNGEFLKLIEQLIGELMIFSGVLWGLKNPYFAFLGGVWGPPELFLNFFLINTQFLKISQHSKTVLFVKFR